MTRSVDKGHDPRIAELFKTSLGPVKSVRTNLTTINHLQHDPKFASYHESPTVITNSDETTLSSKASNASLQIAEFSGPLDNGFTGRQSRKRKLGQDADDLEASYMRQLAREEVKDEQRRATASSTDQGALRTNSQGSNVPTTPAVVNHRSSSQSDVEGSTDESIVDEGKDVPLHETVAPSKGDKELAKASRTVFLANVSTTAIRSKSGRKALLEHLVSFPLNGRDEGAKPTIESIRFRSTPFSDGRLPRKAAYAKKALMDATAKSTNAYAVYTTPIAAREAINHINGSMVLERHLRVDSVAHPAQQNHRKCVFVGNLGFVDDEGAIQNAEDDASKKRRPSKMKEPADYEEGLWRTFKQAGNVESVRLVRDKITRVGKGFAYVQFTDANAVEKALLLNDKKFPPMLPRKLRVVRAKRPKKPTIGATKFSAQRDASEAESYHLRPSSKSQSPSGRAKKLLGRAGAAQLYGKKQDARHNTPRTPESFVFEGYRASQSTVKKGKLAKELGKPQTRSSRRGNVFKRQKNATSET